MPQNCLPGVDFGMFIKQQTEHFERYFILNILKFYTIRVCSCYSVMTTWHWACFDMCASFPRYFSAFWLAGNDEAFLKLWFSIFLSTFGISSGLYLSNHVAIIDFEDLNDDAADTTAHPSSQQIGQAIVGTVPPWPPSQPGQAKLPPPPGLVFPERYFQPCPPNGRQGQQGLATEWFVMTVRSHVFAL